MGTGESPTAPETVQRLRTALHAKAKGSPGFRFYSLCDKVWRADVLIVAWQQIRRNGGAAGVDGETVADIETYGVNRWLGELARDVKEGTYRPNAVRQVLIPNKPRGKFRHLGIPCIRDRVAQTAALLVLSPIFEAELQPEQYAYRARRSAHDAVRRVHRLLNAGRREVVDADLSDYFGQVHRAALERRADAGLDQGVLRGRYVYYGVAGNFRALQKVHRFVEHTWRKMLSSRSRATYITWEAFERIKQGNPLPRPKLRLAYNA